MKPPKFNYEVFDLDEYIKYIEVKNKLEKRKKKKESKKHESKRSITGNSGKK